MHEIIEKKNYIPISFNDLKNKVKLYYDAKNDAIVADLDINIIIHANNTIVASKGDTIVLSGTSGEGNIHLNPI